MEEYPWLEVAQSLAGEKEVLGGVDNPKIVELFRLVGHVEIKDDETAWCAAFVGSCLELSGYKSTRSLSARSYQKFGRQLSTPERGCIAVFWRGSKSSRLGHVGFVDRVDQDFIYVLGGNQGNSVRISAYPAKQLLAYVMPTERGEIAVSRLIPNINQIRARRGLTGDNTGVAGGVFDDLDLGRSLSSYPNPPPDADTFDDVLDSRSDFDEDPNSLIDLVRGLLGDEDINDDLAPAASIEVPTLRRGAQGSAVRDLQQKLTEKGYALGGVDGKYGAMTESAVFEFQRANGLDGTGVVDRSTMESLFGGRGPEISDDRRNADGTTLLSRGSVILRQAQQGNWTAVIASLVAAFGVADSTGIMRRLATTENAELFSRYLGKDGGLWVAMLVAGGFAWTKFDAAARRRVEDHRDGVNRRI